MSEKDNYGIQLELHQYQGYTPFSQFLRSLYKGHINHNLKVFSSLAFKDQLEKKRSQEKILMKVSAL